MNRRQFLTLLAANAWCANRASAQTWPGGVIRLIVAYPPGGPSDPIAPALAEKLTAQLGAQVIVENRAGAGGSVGVDVLSKSAPDGLTLGFVALSPLTIGPHVAKLGYDPFRDVAPVAAVMFSPVYVLATPAFSGNRFEDIVAQAKAKPGALRLGSSGVATVGHIMLEQIKAKAGIEITHIPYKGGGQSIIDAAAGQFELMLSNPAPAVAGQIQAGKLRVLAVAAPQRLASFPGAPTLAELGYPLANITSTFGVFAPGRTPESVVRRLNVEINKALELPDVRERMTRLENIPAPMGTAEFAQLIRSEYDNNARIIRAANIRAE